MKVNEMSHKGKKKAKLTVNIKRNIIMHVNYTEP
jgi:hypothetical protein